MSYDKVAYSFIEHYINYSVGRYIFASHINSIRTSHVTVVGTVSMKAVTILQTYTHGPFQEKSNSPQSKQAECNLPNNGSLS